MKKLIALILTIVLFSVPVSAEKAENSISVDYTDGLVYCTPDYINPQIDYGMTEEEFKKHLIDNDIVFWGTDVDNGLTVEIRSSTTDFSEKVVDLNSLEKAEIDEFRKSLFDEASASTLVNLNNNIYVRCELPHDDVLGGLYEHQYVTVKQGKLYVITVAFESENPIIYEFVEKFIRGIKYSVEAENSDIYLLLLAFMIVAVLAITVCIIIIIVRKIKDNDKNELAEETEESTVKTVKIKSSNNILMIIISTAMALIIGMFGGFVSAKMFVSDIPQGESGGYINQTTDNVTITVDETSNSNIEAIAKKVLPCVVYVRTSEAVDSFLGGNQEKKGEGNGVVYTSDGYIITNYSIIQEVTKNADIRIEVFFQNDKTKPIEAILVGYNVSYDLAVLKIEAEGLVPVSTGDSSDLVVGRYAVAVGSPGGIEYMGTVTYGVISGVNRNAVASATNDTKLSLIQSDAIPTPSFAGGALVNIKGELIGIISDKIVAENRTGIGFAIPVDKVAEVCNKIIDKEDTPAPYIGATFSEVLTPERLEEYGYPVGAVVTSIVENGPFADANIKQGDIITNFGNVPIKDFNELNSLLATYKPGENVAVKFYRSGREHTTSVTIGANNSQ